VPSSKYLKKHLPGRDINDDGTSFNADFACSMQRIKVATVSSKVETTEERKGTQHRIDEKQRHQINVRICSRFSRVQ